MSSEADLKNEIARLTASINQAKMAPYPTYAPRGRGGYRGGYAGYRGSYVSHAPRGNSKFASNKYVRPGLQEPTAATTTPATATSSSASTSTVPSSSTFNFSSAASTSEPASASTPLTSPTTATKDVVLGGVAFESSSRSLVRKDLVKAKPPSSKPPSIGKSAPFPYVRRSGHLVAGSRVYKPKVRRGQNMTLNNTRKSWSAKKRKSINKPCPQFTTTGACNRGLTCMYQHDPSKIAICWNFLQDSCPNTADTCQLSHDPTPERTPLCVHFLNKGRCTRGGCLFPHVNVGKREGICRDFAVLGYCEKGLNCEKQHVRECPDFAENGTCSTKGCKLPHVIRANRNRKAAAASASRVSNAPSDAPTPATNPDLPDSSKEGAPAVYAEDSQLGDEYISLTFMESESEDEDESEEEEGDDGSDGDNDEGPSDGASSETKHSESDVDIA